MGKRQDTRKRAVQFMSHARRQQPERGELLRPYNLGLRQSQLTSLVLHFVRQFLRPIAQLLVRFPQILGHIVKGLCKVSEFIAAGHRDEAIQVTVGDPSGAVQQTLHRPVDQPVGEQSDQPTDHDTGRQSEKNRVARGFGHVMVGLLQGNADVNDAQQALALGVGVARGIPAGRFIVDDVDGRQRAVAVPRSKDPGSLGSLKLGEWLLRVVALVACLRLSIHDLADLALLGGIRDHAPLVENPDVINALLLPNLLDHLVHVLPAGMQHGVTRTSPHRVRKPHGAQGGLRENLGPPALRRQIGVDPNVRDQEAREWYDES